MSKSAPSTPPHPTKPVPPNAPKRKSKSNDGVYGVDSTPTGPNEDVYMVVAFNKGQVEIYEDQDALGGDVILVDISGSVSGPNAILLRTAVAAMTKGTKSHGKFVIPKPDGTTAIIAAVEYCLKIPNCGTIYLFTDGEENCWSGPLTIGHEYDGSSKIVDVSFYSPGPDQIMGNSTILADYLQESGVKVCILGIGPAAKPMVSEMVGRKNVFCGHVDHGADTRAIVSTVRTLKNISNGGRSSVTRNGTQHAVLVCLSDDVQEAIKKMTPAEIDEFEDAVGTTIISGTDIVTPSDLKGHIERVFDAYDEPVPDEHVMNIKAALLLFMVTACDEELPGALITSKHSAIIGVPGGWKPFRRHCNRLLSRLANADVLIRAGPVPDGGKVVTQNGHQHKFAAGCAQYSCSIIKATVTGLAEDGTYCTPRDNLPAPKMKKRKLSNNTASAKRMRVN